MKTTCIIIILICASNAFSQIENYKKTIFENWQMLDSYDVQYNPEDETGEGIRDSIIKYNDVLLKSISRGFEFLTPDIINELTDSTEMSIVKSAYGRVKIISWAIYKYSSEPSYNSVTMIDNVVHIFSKNVGNEDDFGLNSSIDSIIEVKENQYYLLFGYNKCGSLCVTNFVSLYFKKNDELYQCVNSFNDSGFKYTDLFVTYIPNRKIKKDPEIILKDRTIICPIISDDGLYVKNYKTYEIILD